MKTSIFILPFSLFALGGCAAGGGAFDGGAKPDYKPSRSMITLSEPSTSGRCLAVRVRLVNGAVWLEC